MPMPNFEDFDREEFMNGVKDKYEAGMEYAKDKFSDGMEYAKDKFNDAVDYAKEKTNDVASKLPSDKDAGMFASMKDKIIQLTPEYIKTHPWAAGLGASAALGVLLLAYAAWKRKNKPNKLVEEMCILYPLMDEYSESLSESYNFDNYSTYVDLSKRMETVGPMVLDMMLKEDEDLADGSEADFDPNGSEPVETSVVKQILDWFRESGNAAVEKFLEGYNITMEWVKEHPGVAGAGALAAILGTYGVYKLISLYKESREKGDVDKEKIAESLCMLSDFMSVCESYDPNMSEAQKYKNITLLCDIINSDL